MSERWYLHDGTSERVPFSTEVVIYELEAGHASDETPIRRDGEIKWRRIRQVSGLSSGSRARRPALVSGLTPPPAPETAPAEPVPLPA